MGTRILAVDLGKFNSVLCFTAVKKPLNGELVLVMSDGDRETWTRAPAE
jgi:hypothetical protein